MKIRPKTACVTIIFVMLFLCAIVVMRYFYLKTPPLFRFYLVTQLSIVLLCIIYIISKLRMFVLRPFPLLLLGMISYELIISYAKGLFLFPVIFVEVLAWPLIFYVFYDYSIEHDIPISFSIIANIGLTIVCLISLPNILYREMTGSGIFATYYCVTLLSLQYLTSKNDTTSLIFSIIVAILMLLTIKRGGIMAAIVGISVYYLLKAYIEEENIKKVKRLFVFCSLAIVLLFIGIYMINVLNLGIIDRMESTLVDSGSGRLFIWELVMDKYNASTNVDKLFGHGFQAVYYLIQPLGIQRFAHNSYIEYLYDYGIIGAIMIILFSLVIIFKTWKTIREKKWIAPVMGYTVVVMLFFSLISSFFEQSIIISPLCAVWGICLGSDLNKKRRRGQ